MNADQFQLLVPRLQEALRLAITEALIESAKLIADEAKNNIIGHDQPDWPPFAPETEQRHKAPLERTEALKESIEYVVSGHEAAIGTNSPYAKYQEHGTEHNPPRPFLSKAAINKSEEVAALVGAAVAKVFKP